jgi:hypothetical protein
MREMSRVQIVAMTDYQLSIQQEQYRDFFNHADNPVPYWFVELHDEVDGAKRLAENEEDEEALDGRDW